MTRSLLRALALAANLVALSMGIAATGYAQNVNAQTGTTYTFLNTDCSKIVTFNNASAIAATLPVVTSVTSATTGAFLAGCRIEAIDLGAGALTITPTTSTIGGAATLVLTEGQSATFTSDGTNYQLEPGALGVGAWTANGVVASTITSLGPTGSHTTIQEWLAINHGGVTRYIPLY